METVNALGRRKSAIARIYVNEGKGKIVVNNRAFEEYFPLQQTQNIIQQPLTIAEAGNKYDITAVSYTHLTLPTKRIV